MYAPPPFSGTVTELQVQRSSNGRSRGTASAKYSNAHEASAALGAAGTDVGGRPLRIRLDRFA